MAFPLSAIGAGLGLFAEDYRKQQEANLRQQQFRQQLLEQQRQETAAQGLFSALGNLGAGQGVQYQPIQPGGGVGSGLDMGTGAVADQNQPLYRGGAARQPMAGSGGGGMGGNIFRDALRQQFGQLGLPPTYADAAAAYMQRNESGNNPLAVNPTSGALGRAQWLGPRKQQLLSKYGPQPSDEQQASFIGEELRGPENKTLAALRTAAESGAPPKAAYDTWGKAYERPGPAALAKAGVDNPMVKAQYEVQQGAQSVAQNIDPAVQGRMALQALVQQINQAMPSADPVAKMMALEKLQGLMAPYEKQKWELFKQQHEEAIWKAHADYQDQLIRGRERPDIKETSEGIVSIAPGATTATPITGSGGQPLKGKAARQTSHNVEVTDAEGKVIFSGSAHPGPEGVGWIADKDNTPVSVPGDANIKILGTGGQGRQAAQQIQSMIGSTSEIVGEAKNLMELPAGSVAGIFQGLQSVPAPKMGEAMSRALANKLTPEESTDLATSFQGVARALATIEAQGRATGLVGLTGLSQGLMPQTGDTTGNILRKYATIRQIVERNTDAIMASPNATAEQRNLLKKLRDEMAEVIPFSVSEVNKLQHGDTATVQDAARKFGLAGGEKGSSGPKEGDIATSPGKPDLIFRGGKWVPVEPPT